MHTAQDVLSTWNRCKSMKGICVNFTLSLAIGRWATSLCGTDVIVVQKVQEHCKQYQIRKWCCRQMAPYRSARMTQDTCQQNFVSRAADDITRHFQGTTQSRLAFWNLCSSWLFPNMWIDSPDNKNSSCISPYSLIRSNLWAHAKGKYIHLKPGSKETRI